MPGIVGQQGPQGISNQTGSEKQYNHLAKEISFLCITQQLVFSPSSAEF